VTGRRVGCSAELEGTIYISPMSEFHYEDYQLRVSDLVNDSVLALSHAIPIAVTRKLLASSGPGVLTKNLDPTHQTLAILFRGDGQEFLSGRGFDQ
jgi:hypothetical protein